jgi:glutaredoxin
LVYIFITQDSVNDAEPIKQYLRSKYGYRNITILTLDGVPTIFISGKKVEGGVREIEKLNAEGLLDS